MFNNATERLTAAQQFALVTLRILIGWHFLYEAYYKISSPAWSPAGTGPLAHWTSAGYLKGATGPLAGLLQKALAHPNWMLWIDRSVKIGLLLVGLSLVLGLFTRLGAFGAFLLLSMFYVLYIPTMGIPQPNAEGTYLIVNKTLIEAVAVVVLFVFDTGRIAGLELLFSRRPRRQKTVVTEPVPDKDSI
jgi:thiosulfate dehydrogenase (quinone) large subunit